MVINLRYKVKQPAPGETRIVKRFAWKPVQIGTQVIWLGWYYTLQGYFYQDYAAIISNDGKPEQKGFRVGKWVNLSSSLKK